MAAGTGAGGRHPSQAAEGAGAGCDEGRRAAPLDVDVADAGSAAAETGASYGNPTRVDLYACSKAADCNKYPETKL